MKEDNETNIFEDNLFNPDDQNRWRHTINRQRALKKSDLWDDQPQGIVLSFSTGQRIDESKLEPVRKYANYGEVIENLILRFNEGENNNYKERLLDTLDQTYDEPYIDGCVHDCVYREDDGGVWNSPMPIPVNVDESVDVIGKNVYKGGIDPCPWMDRKYQKTLSFLEKKQGHKLTINTKSDLIAYDQYIDALDRENHEIIFHFVTFNDEINRIIEPGTPSSLRRLKAFSKLKELGYNAKICFTRLNIKASWNTIRGLDLKERNALFTKNLDLNDDQINQITKSLGKRYPKKKSA